MPDAAVVDAVLHAFDAFQDRFQAITERAQERFEERDRDGMRADTDERLDLYRHSLDDVEAELREHLGKQIADRDLWAATKTAYADRVDGRPDWELAETYFNSVTRRIFDTVGVDARIEFVASEFAPPEGPAHARIYDVYRGSIAAEALVENILTSLPFDVGFQDLRRDVGLAAGELRQHLRDIGATGEIEQIEVASPIFYRGMGAYVLGRMRTQSQFIPLALAIRNTPDGLVVDAVLLNEDEVSILFSFARSYFHVRAERPRELVTFLKRIIPRKRLAELYISIGYNRHGKTELYRNLVDHLAHSDDVFERARGQRGMVMTVFTMPSYDMVFKIFKDQFDYPKNITRQQAKERYGLVYKHDRAGRLVDAQEFEHLELDRSHFAGELLEELTDIAGGTVHIAENGEAHVTIDHTYVQRRVTPLNIYLREHEDDEAATRAALIDYGNAIKELAVTNIFTGDLLLKNFGVTRHGRVVFYDYDELCLLTDCQFKVKPEPKTHMQEMASEPWYYVGPDDIFPEEFRSALGLNREQMETFETYHAGIFEADWWQGVQERLAAGEEIPIYPYPPDRRITRQWDPNAEVVPEGPENG